MFESLMERSSARGAARKAASLPMAIVLHGLVILAFIALSSFAREVLQPPPVTVRFFGAPTPRPYIPITRTDEPKPEKPPRVAERSSRPIPPGELTTPKGVLDRIPPPGPPSESSDGPEIDGAFPLGKGDQDLGESILTGDGFGGSKPPVIRVGGKIRPPKVLFQAQPVYPPAAAAMGLSGRVVLEVTINERGEVVEAQVVRSDNGLFDAAALEAVRRWKFSPPATEAGQIVWVYHYVIVNFRPMR